MLIDTAPYILRYATYKVHVLENKFLKDLAVFRKSTLTFWTNEMNWKYVVCRRSTRPATPWWTRPGGPCSPTVSPSTRSCPSSTTPNVTTTWRSAPLRWTWRPCATSCPPSPAIVRSVDCLCRGITTAPTSHDVVRHTQTERNKKSITTTCISISIHLKIKQLLNI